MRSGESFDIIFGVTADKEAWLLHAPPEVVEYLIDSNGSLNMKEGGFRNLPIEVGVYSGKARLTITEFNSLLPEDIADDDDFFYSIEECAKVEVKGS